MRGWVKYLLETLGVIRQTLEEERRGEEERAVAEERDKKMD